MKRVLITGGAGFIGSHLVDAMIRSHEVCVLDDLSEGSIENIESHLDNEQLTFVKGSILSVDDVMTALENVDTVFHFAAQPDVRVSTEKPYFDFQVNVIGSMNLLEAVRSTGIRRFVFASSGGTVYGESQVHPTPESTCFRPISNYGAGKGAFEMYLSSYSELYGIDSVSMRLANIIGPRSRHGIIYDFFMKLKNDASSLEVLGNGSQEKTYMYVTDTVAAAILLANNIGRGFLPINVGSSERLRVSKIAQLVLVYLGLPDTKINYTGTARGWVGDISLTDMDNKLLRSYGWEQRTPLEEGVKLYVDWLKETFGFP
ncbi:MAG: NAD-dependent epimerase/dehydratase family protein [Candidatus Thorarchaeota archaeon]